MYKSACELIKGKLVIGNVELDSPTPRERIDLDKAISLFVEVVAINPGNWAAMWLLGKIYSRLEKYKDGLTWFTRSHQVNPDHPDVAREGSIAAMELGQAATAIPFCRRALEANPDDPGLRANLALALLCSGSPHEAHTFAVEALTQAPDDAITARLVKTIEEVLHGRRACPRHPNDIV